MIKAVTSSLLIGLTGITCQPAGTNSSGPDIIIASDMPTSAFEGALPWEQAVGYVIRQQASIAGLKVAFWPLDDTIGATPSQVRGRANLKRIVADRRVLGMIAGAPSSLAVVEIPVANLAGLAMLSPAETGTCLTVADPGCQTPPADLRPSGKNNYFRIAPRDPLAGRTMARYAATRLNVRRVAVFNEFEDGSVYVKEFSNELANFGGQIVFQQDLAFGTNDFTAFLKEAAAHHADAVAGMAYGDYDGCLMAAQMTKLVPDAFLLGIDGMALNEQCAQDAGPTPPKFYASYPDVDPRMNADPLVKPKVDAYLKAHPKASDVPVYTFAAYDCAQIMIDAIGRAVRSNGGKVPSRAQVLAALETTNSFVGVTGTYSFDKNGDALSPMFSMYELQGGHWVNKPL